jgi:hypothetical protein
MFAPEERLFRESTGHEFLRLISGNGCQIETSNVTVGRLPGCIEPMGDILHPLSFCQGSETRLICGSRIQSKRSSLFLALPIIPKISVNWD